MSLLATACKEDDDLVDRCDDEGNGSGVNNNDDVYDGDGEHVASLGGGGAVTVPKGASVPGRVSGLHDNVDWEVVK